MTAHHRIIIFVLLIFVHCIFYLLFYITDTCYTYLCNSYYFTFYFLLLNFETDVPITKKSVLKNNECKKMDVKIRSNKI